MALGISRTRGGPGRSVLKAQCLEHIQASHSHGNIQNKGPFNQHIFQHILVFLTSHWPGLYHNYCPVKRNCRRREQHQLSDWWGQTKPGSASLVMERTHLQCEKVGGRCGLRGCGGFFLFFFFEFGFLKWLHLSHECFSFEHGTWFFFPGSGVRPTFSNLGKK